MKQVIYLIGAIVFLFFALENFFPVDQTAVIVADENAFTRGDMNNVIKKIMFVTALALEGVLLVKLFYLQGRTTGAEKKIVNILLVVTVLALIFSVIILLVGLAAFWG